MVSASYHFTGINNSYGIYPQRSPHAIAQEVNMARAVASITLQKNRAQEKSLRNNVNLEDVSYTCKM